MTKNKKPKIKRKQFNLDKTRDLFSYVPNNSFLHKLNPISKLFFLILFTIFVFSIESLIFLSIVFALTFFLALSSKMSIKSLFYKFKWILILSLFSIILNIFFNAIPNEESQILFYLFNLTFLPIRRLAVYYAFRNALWILILFLSAIIFTHTTSMKDFVYAMMKTGVSYKYSFAFMVGLRYIPLIQQEARTIGLAQKARGFGREKVNTLKKAYNFIKERLITILVSILRKGDITSISMENRCFGLYKTRTNLIEIPFKKKDIIFILTIGALFMYYLLSLIHFIPFIQFPSLYSLFFT